MEKLTIGDQEFAIELKNINFVLKHPSVTEAVEYEDRLPLSPRETVYHGNRVQNLHPIFPVIWEIAFTDLKEHMPDPKPAQIRKLDEAFIHLMGLIDLSLKLLDQKVPFVWIRPESYLYPQYQANLADVLIELDRYAKPTF